MPPNFAPYQPRPIRFLKLLQAPPYQVKLYSITQPDQSLPQALQEETENQIKSLLQNTPTQHQHYGVAFAAIHAGIGENQIILDRWINENELMHQILVSPESDPLAFQPPPADHNSVCVWELALQAFEREQWLKHVLQAPSEPSIERYLKATFNSDL